MLAGYLVEITTTVSDINSMNITVQHILGGAPAAHVCQVQPLPGQFNNPLVAHKVYRLLLIHGSDVLWHRQANTVADLHDCIVY